MLLWDEVGEVWSLSGEVITVHTCSQQHQHQREQLVTQSEDNMELWWSLRKFWMKTDTALEWNERLADKIDYC